MATRTALIDHVLTMAICHPVDVLTRETIASLVRAQQFGPDHGTFNFEIYTSENVQGS